MEEDEARREKEEEERKQRGEGGMTGWNRKVLEREEERMKLVEEGVERLRREKGQAGEERSGSRGPLEGSDPHHAYDLPEAEAPTAAATEANEAAALNARGAHISLNDDGDVVDQAPTALRRSQRREATSSDHLLLIRRKRRRSES